MLLLIGCPAGTFGRRWSTTSPTCGKPSPTRSPTREALICGERRLTYAETEERANRLAHYLAAQGIGPDDHVALLLYNGTEYLEGMLAAFKLRAVPINVNYRYMEEELRYILDDCDAKAIVFHREFAPKLAAIGGELPRPRHLPRRRRRVRRGRRRRASTVGAVGYEDALAGASPVRDFGPRSADDHYILYTGGTTGNPKGVIWRAEDIFFGGLGGGNLGEAPITKPEEITDQLDPGRRTLPACPAHARHRALVRARARSTPAARSCCRPTVVSTRRDSGSSSRASR